MSSYKDLFPGSRTASITSPVAADSGEISLRDEMIMILNGGGGEIAKGQTFLFRRLRRDANGNTTTCVCVDPTTKEPDIDYICPHCLGTGKLWDEEMVVGYKVNLSATAASRATELAKEAFGQVSLPGIVFYFDYSIHPKIWDRIVEVELDLEGTPEVPYNRLAQYEINILRDLRADNGRVEFWACYCISSSLPTKAGVI